MASTYRDSYKNINTTTDYHTKENFEIAAFCQSKYENAETNMLSRLRNSLITGINEKTKLPRFIVVVLDNDLIEYIEYAGQGASTLLGNCVEWICEQFVEVIGIAKDALPQKAKKAGYPQIYWVAPPYHKNFMNNKARSKLTNVLETAFKLFTDIRVIRMKESWNSQDSNLVNEYGQFTEDGWITYWKSIDKAIKFNAKKRDLYLANQTRNANFVEMKKENGGVKRHLKNTERDGMYQFFKKHKKNQASNQTPRKLPVPK